MGGRAGRLSLLVVLGTLGLFLRLAQIQVGEHEVWAAQAARLVRSGTVLPYRRGAIVDAEGRVLARDREAYHLVLSYRDFRRGHPLGQVAHARSVLEQRAVPLDEALLRLEPWALELVRLPITDLDVFAEGGPLDTASLRFPAHPDPAADLRAGRASDVRFYLGALLELDPSEWKALREARREGGPQPSLATLVARWRGLDGPAAAEQRLRERVILSLAHLRRLAEELHLEDEAGSGPPLERLVALLERRRRDVEDSTASRLFREAAGFDPGRVTPELCERYFDVGWIARRLRWEPERTRAWLHAARVDWRGRWRDHYALPHLLAEARLRGEGAERLLDLLSAVARVPGELEAALNGRPGSWRRMGAPEVFARLGGLFEADLPEDYDPERDPVLPLHDRNLRARTPRPGEEWTLLEDALGLGVDPAAVPGAAREPGERARLWRRLAHRSDWASREATKELASELVDAWDYFLQLRLAEVLGAVARGAEPAARGPTGALLFAEERLERAGERARFVLRDYGSREVLLDSRPAYEVVHLLTRYPEHYAGFHPRDARERLLVRLEDEVETPGELLIGRVSPLDPEAMQRQRLRARRFEELRATPVRTPAEQAELARLVGEVGLRGEVRGADGLEALYDEELRGSHGYLEHLGLEDVYGRGARSEEVQEVVDGRDLHLTLDADLQRAAEDVLENPYLPPEEELRDERWFAEPVGALVVLTVEGDVAAAASVPHRGSEIGDGAREARRQVLERTLRIPDFQPPGSVFKPFVAAWALEHLGLDPARHVACEPQPDDPSHASYGGVRCWVRWGHGPEVDLGAALEQSCNSYFAWLGDAYDDLELYRMATHFGFGEPTGIRPEGDRIGLREDLPRRFLEGPFAERERRLAANGLGIVEATPMHVARATAALATGELPEVRLVARVGDEVRPRAPARPVEIDPRHLALVRRHLFGVTNDRRGTAHRALRSEVVGFEISAKTGSADLGARSSTEEGEPVLKHTWVAGWFPPEEPEAVFVVFLHRTRYTSSHTAVHVARQFLRRPELAEWRERAREGRP